MCLLLSHFAIFIASVLGVFKEEYPLIPLCVCISAGFCAFTFGKILLINTMFLLALMPLHSLEQQGNERQTKVKVRDKSIPRFIAQILPARARAARVLHEADVGAAEGAAAD